MKRNLIIIVLLFIGAIVLILAGNIITIGNKLYELSQVKWVEYGFYLTILAVFVYVVIYPLLRLHATPPFPKLSVDAYIGDDERTIKELKTFSKSLANNMYYLPADERAERKKKLLSDVGQYYNAEDLRGIIQKELDNRYENIKSHINEWAKTVFMLTAVSQNGKIDSAISMVINFRMIADLIRCSGYRPTHRQLFKQYVRILTTALFSYYLSNSLEDFDDIEIPFGSEDDVADSVVDSIDIDEDAVTETGFLSSLSGLKIAGLIPASLLDGALNSLLTLRIGYVTIAYLQEGSEGLSGRNGMKVRRHAMLEAIKAFGPMAKDTTIEGLAFMGNKISELLKKTKEYPQTT